MRVGQTRSVTQGEATYVGGEEGCGIEERGGAWLLVTSVEEEVANTVKVEGWGTAASTKNKKVRCGHRRGRDETRAWQRWRCGSPSRGCGGRQGWHKTRYR